MNKGQLTVAVVSALLFSFLSAPARFQDEFAEPGSSSRMACRNPGPPGDKCHEGSPQPNRRPAQESVELNWFTTHRAETDYAENDQSPARESSRCRVSRRKGLLRQHCQRQEQDDEIVRL